MLQANLLRGDRVRLTAVDKRDLAAMAQWWADADFLRLYDAVPAYPKTEAQLAQRIEEGQKGDQVFLFGIRLLASDELIGLLELDGILWTHGTTYLSIGIGPPGRRGQGLGYEAMRLGLRYAFRELNLYRVCVTVFSYNRPAITLYEKLGFIREGVYRQHLQRDGQRFDMFLYGLLRPEWEAAQAKPAAGASGTE